MKTLEIGKDYGSIFGIDSKTGKKVIYMGGNTWKAVMPGKGEMVKESEGTTKNAIEYINRPSYTMGSM